MVADLVKRISPEEDELNRKRDELAQLGNELAEKELELATQQAELKEFQKLYYRAVGGLHAILDDLEAQIAERIAKKHPGNEKAQRHATRVRERAAESARESEYARRLETRSAFSPTDELKRLFREIAKLFHPDLASDDHDYHRRHELMIVANQAYQDGSEVVLRQLLADWKNSPESVEGTGVGADLIRVIRKIAQMRKRLPAVAEELRQLQKSDLFQLKVKVEDATKTGRDLLAEMANRLDGQIQEAQARLSALSSETEYGRR